MIRTTRTLTLVAAEEIWKEQRTFHNKEPARPISFELP